ncbi:glycoside hydrolase family 3 C-terminal domain-containing protein [Carboxylicivirga sp. RSCT41]|uniref:glycoside hydrolase family 3 protein n=1 Tax=Carboxylicivirga agarovorans TaxID=3417570 RepID=UPI003D344A32
MLNKIPLSKSTFVAAFLFLILLGFSQCKKQDAYKDTSLSFEERVNDLVSRMTLEEKVSQLSYTSKAIPHLNIPEYNWWNECLHGVGRAGISTVFPQAIGMAAMWNDSAMFNIANAVSDEARAKHHDFVRQNKRGIYQGLTFWTPNINIFRDPRWGRGMETYGEDPFLSGKLGVSYIKGLQGNDSKYYKLIATAKHFAVHSGPEVSRHSFDVTPSSYDFIETYAPQFKMAVDEANVYSVMCAYNRYKGEPCCGSVELSNLLRDNWGFDGYIVSDCWAVRDFYEQNAHEVVNTKAEAAAIAVKAGTDLNCGDSYPALTEAVKLGYITEKEIDVSLKRLLLARMKLGMFDDEKDVPFASIPYEVVNSHKHQELALNAARQSMVLLENKQQTLPFSKEVKNVAVIGPNANDVDVLLGNYHGYASNPITPFAGIKNKLPNAQVNYAAGCHLAEGLPLLTAIPTEALFADNELKTNGLKAEYFNNDSCKGEPVLSRIDKQIDFKWWNQSPDSSVDVDTFSVRWSGFIKAPLSGKYAIGIEGFPFVKLMVNGEELISYKNEHHPQKQYEFLQFEKDKTYEVCVEYFQTRTEYASAHLLWEMPNKNLKKEALELAAQSDLVVMCMGLSPLLEGEEMKVKVDGFSGGDRDHIQLPQTQKELIKAIHALGKPTVLVLLNGSALAFNWEAENLPAIIEAWYPGQAGGQAIADVIFGDYNPSGRLPLTFYKSVNQLPSFDDYRMDNRTYRYFTGEPLYPFGYGLSYTSFEYSELIMQSSISGGENLDVSVKVSNSGKFDSDEVVQLYVSHPDYEGKKAIRSLKGFQRIHLNAGESQYVNFQLSPKDIAILNDEMKYELLQGQVNISVGGQQANEKAIEQKQLAQGNVQVNLINNEPYLIEN